MKRVLNAMLVASSLMLAACNGPGSIPAPDPAGKWQATYNDETGAKVTDVIEVKPGGNFRAELHQRFRDSSQEITGQWRASDTWDELSYFERTFTRRSETEHTTFGPGGSKRERRSRTQISVEYSLKKGEMIPEGGTLVKRGNGIASRLLFAPDGRINALGVDESLIRETMTLRRTQPYVDSRHTILILVAAIADLLPSSDDTAEFSLMYRGRLFRRDASR